MTKSRLEIACPFCKADAGQPCFSVEGHKMKYFHNQRTLRDRANQPIIKGIAPIPKD
jgi:hypothetical protein